MPYPRVTHGRNELLFADDGTAYVDLISSTGAVLLGHANEAVNAHVVAQLGRLSCSWTSQVDVWDTCVEVVGAHVPGDLHLCNLYSSGTEAVEAAMRLAVHETGRPTLVGFATDNHGRSMAIQGITDLDPGIPGADHLRSIPFLPDRAEDDVLAELDALLRTRTVAAVLVEPLQGKGGGHAPSDAFQRALQDLCRSTGTLLVYDEIFTGFHRTGPCLLHTAVGVAPDVVLVGKAMANGFPAAGLLLRPGIEYHPKDPRLSSTFSGNPLACAAVIGTIREMERIGVEGRVAAIEAAFGRLAVPPGAEVRLRGAACFVDLHRPLVAAAVAQHLFAHGVLVLQRGTTVGFWPPATIPDATLAEVVELASARLEEVA
jgi:4-aminobutyrate aminotransferase-like enzyme